MKKLNNLIIASSFYLLTACGVLSINTNTNLDAETASLVAGSTATGEASYYGGKFNGRKTASGEVLDKNKLTAAHKSLPFQTKVQVKNLKNGKTVLVKINDRMPKTSKRVIDLSEGAAQALGMLKDGVVKVELKVMK